MDEAGDNSGLAVRKGGCSGSTLMDICHLQNAELEPQFQKCKGRVVLRGDIVKDDSGSYAAFTEQGSSASQMTAAKVIAVIARLPDCDGQAADEIICLHSCKTGGCPNIAQNSKVRMSRFLGTLSTTQVAQHHGHTLKIQWFLVNDICTGTHLRYFLGKDSSRKFYWSLDGKTVPNWEFPCVYRKQGLILSAHVDDMNMAGKKQTMAPMWKRRSNFISWPRVFGMHSTWMQTERNHYVNNTETCSNHEFLLEQLKNYQGREKPHAKAVAWSYDTEGHVQKCVERDCELAYKETEQLYTVSSPCLNDHRFNMEELESVEELSAVCSQIVLKCLYLARIDRPDISLTVSKLARSVTKWTRTCDRRLARLHSSHEWLPAILSCGKHGSALSIGFLPRLRFCWGPWGFEINLGEHLMKIWKSHICSHWLDV